MLRRLTRTVRRLDAACNTGAPIVGSLMLGIGVVALLGFGVRAAAEFVDMPIAGPQAGEDGFPWVLAVCATLFAAAAFWAVLSACIVGDDGDDEEPDFRDAESRGERTDG